MIEEIALERVGGQELVKRLTKLNACGLAVARRLALNPGSASRLRIASSSHASYRDLSDMEIEHIASQPVFLFRPSSLTEALSQPSPSASVPDGELLRRFLLLLRDLSAHGVVFPVVVLGLDPSDVERARRFTDDDFESLNGGQGLTFEPRLEPVYRLRSTTEDGWDQELFLAELLKDLNRQLVKSRKSTPKSRL